MNNDTPSQNKTKKAGMAVYTCNLSTWEAEDRRITSLRPHCATKQDSASKKKEKRKLENSQPNNLSCPSEDKNIKYIPFRGKQAKLNVCNLVYFKTIS
jgi:hypothetical protein